MSEDVGNIKPIRIRIPITIHILKSPRFSMAGRTHANNQMSRAGIAMSRKPTDTPARVIIPKTPNNRITISGMEYFFKYYLSIR